VNVLVVGGGGREHALCWKFAQSGRLSSLVCAPGNAGTAEIAENVAIRVSEVDRLTEVVKSQSIDLVVVGPEEPLSLGVADAITAIGVPVFGPTQRAARIETSKSWAKQIMRQAGVPTARSRVCRSLGQALELLEQFGLPVVIKADGLAAGKGVVVAATSAEAEGVLRSFLEERLLGESGATVLVEEHLSGWEVSFFALSDGETTVPLGAACDYKRALDGDLGPNTGGMGAFAPVPELTNELQATIMRTVVDPTIQTMRSTNSLMSGVIFCGLMMTEDGPKVLEFNARFGDPETQVMLPLLDCDLLDLLFRTATGTLDAASIADAAGAAVAVVLASEGYPGSYRTGLPIEGLNLELAGTEVFHAGTTIGANGEVATAGGRVLSVVGRGNDHESARNLAYERASQITFDGCHYRKDIGSIALATAGSSIRNN
jgi:phosphoribosylamine---glycine ligase